MLGLFCRTYDYYEWDALVAVSLSKEKLVQKYHTIETEYELIDNGEYEKKRDGEVCHYAIVEIELIE